MKLIKLSEWDSNNRIFAGYTTVRRKGKLPIIFSPSTYVSDSWTDYAWGENISLSLEKMIQKFNENPKAYVHFLVDDGTITWVQLKNIRLVMRDKR